MIRSRTLVPALLLAAGLGCFRPSPPLVYHTLQPLREAAPAPRSGLAVEVLPVRLPDLLQRPQLVMALGPGTAELSGTHRWGNPLEQDMQRVLVDNLALLLGSDAVVASPLGDRVAADYRVEVDVRGCAAWPAGGLTLDAAWMVTRPGAARAVLRQIRSRLDLATLAAAPADHLEMNDVAEVQLALQAPVPADPFAANPATGAFILIDEHSNGTVAAGLIKGMAT